MIASLFGKVRNLQADKVIIDVGGVGLSVLITPATSARLSVGSAAQFFPALVVREDSLTLFGFLDDVSRALFELVQTVSGIGPKVAMSILAVMSPDDLASAVAQENVASIERVPGIGKKGAQRLILELKGKVFSTSGTYISHVAPWREQLVSALLALGFTARDAESAIGALVVSLQDIGEDPAQMEMGELLKRALQKGSRGRS